MSNDLSMRVSMDTIRPVSQPRDTDGQIQSVSRHDRDVVVNVRDDVVVSGNDVPAESRVVQETESSILNRAVDDLSQHAQNINRDLAFSVDEDLGKTVITVTDAETDEVIRQIPSEEFLELARQLKSQESSVLVSVKA